MRRVIPYLLLSALAIVTLGAAILGSRSRSMPSPLVLGTSCDLLTPEYAATLGGPVQGPPASPFFTQECAYVRGSARLSVEADTNLYAVSQVRTWIAGRLALTCASISAPPNCTVPPVHRSEIDGHQFVWLNGHGLDPKTSGTAITLRDGYVIETLASEVPNFRLVVLGSMKGVLDEKG